MKRIVLAIVVLLQIHSCDRKLSNPNILLFTADDLGIESVGCFGANMQGLTPTIDHFASEGIRFMHAHVNQAICMPSRYILHTGFYGHNSGAMGFIPARDSIITLMELMQEAGYMTGILGKVHHSTPNKRVSWDYSYDRKDLGDGRSPEIYYQRCKAFFDLCKSDGKPFYFMINSHDPHRPFQIPGKLSKGAENPSRYFLPEETVVPDFLPDLPNIRKEISYYHNSVRRLDDTFRSVLLALEESGLKDNTIIMFLSDNGVSLPFAKCNTYLSSTHTPWIVSWPGVVRPNSVDRRHFISGIDYMPTILEAAGIKTKEKLDGKSFIPLLKGESQIGREMVYTQIDRQAGDQAVPMRCVQDEDFGYIFTPWSDGNFRYKNNNEGMTMKAMEAAAESNDAIAERVKLYRYRVLEELYNFKKDPNCLQNLIDDPEYQSIRKKFSFHMATYMKETNDPLLEVFMNRYDESARKRGLKVVYGEDYNWDTK